MPVPNESHERNLRGNSNTTYIDTNPVETNEGCLSSFIPFRIAMWIFDFLFAERG